MLILALLSFPIKQQCADWSRRDLQLFGCFVNNLDWEGKEEHFILEEYDIESDAEIQIELLKKYVNSFV